VVAEKVVDVGPFGGPNTINDFPSKPLLPVPATSYKEPCVGVNPAIAVKVNVTIPEVMEYAVTTREFVPFPTVA
jgi:hypothetical protein